MAETTYLEAIRQGLFEEMERDPEVLCLGEDIGAYGGAFKVTEGLQARFGERRVIDTPLSEAAIVGAAAGAAHMGMRPVCEMQFIEFISCAYDMLTNYVATARFFRVPWWFGDPAAGTFGVDHFIRRIPRRPSSILPGSRSSIRQPPAMPRGC
jgi:deoxyxylulose-5-phosphate synthase